MGRKPKWTDEQLVAMKQIIDKFKGTRNPVSRNKEVEELNHNFGLNFPNYKSMRMAFVYTMENLESTNPGVQVQPSNGGLDSGMASVMDAPAPNYLSNSMPLDKGIDFASKQLVGLNADLVEAQQTLKALKEKRNNFVSERANYVVGKLTEAHDYLIKGWNLDNYVSKDGKFINLGVDQIDTLKELTDLVDKSKSIKYIPLILVQGGVSSGDDSAIVDKYLLVPFTKEDILVEPGVKNPLDSNKPSSVLLYSINMAVADLYQKPLAHVSSWNGFTAIPLGKPKVTKYLPEERVKSLQDTIDTMVDGFMPNVAKNKELNVITDSLDFYKGL